MASSHLFASSGAHTLTPASVPASSAVESIEYGDYYPLMAGRCPEDTLTLATVQNGFCLGSLYLEDEFRVLSKSAPALKDKRNRLREKLLEVAQVAPKKQRVNRPIPQLIVGGNKEQREEWLRQLAADTPLSDLSRSPPHGLRGASFLDEMSGRLVPVVRAVWFMKLIGVQAEAQGGMRNNTANQRNKTWTDEIKKYIEGAISEMGACWRVSNSINSTTLIFTSPQSEAAALRFLQTTDATNSAMLNLQARFEACGLELLAQPLAASSAASSSSSSPPVSSGDSRWVRASHKYLYTLDLLEYAFHDGCIARVSWITWIVEQLSAAAASNWGIAPAGLVRFISLAMVVLRFLPTLASSRAHAHKLFNACRGVQDKFSAHALANISSSSLLQSAAASCLQLSQLLMRTLATLLPNTQAWFVSTAHVSAAAAVDRNALNGWQWQWIDQAPECDLGDESDEDGDQDALMAEPSSIAPSRPQSIRSLVSSPLAAFSGVVPLASCADSWQTLFPRFLTYCSTFILHAAAQGAQHKSLLPQTTIRSRLVSQLQRQDFSFVFPSAVAPLNADVIDLFDSAQYLAASSSSSHSPTPHARLLRQIPDFAQSALPMLLSWCIQSSPLGHRRSECFVAMILASYFPASTTTQDAIRSSLLGFLVAFRPASLSQLARITQLYALLTTMDLFPYARFVQEVLNTGAAESTARSSGQHMDLGSWPELARFYLTHLPLPLLEPTSSSSALLPSGVQTDRVRIEDSLGSTTRQMKWLALGGSGSAELRAADLVFLDIVWTWNNDLARQTPEDGVSSELASAIPEVTVLLHAHLKRGEVWTLQDRQMLPNLWAQRGRSELTAASSFPSVSLQLCAPSASSSAAPVRQMGPALQPPSCRPLSLLAMLPLHIAQLTIDQFIGALQRRMEASTEFEQSTILASARFVHAVSSLISLLESLDLSLSLQLLLQWLIELVSASASGQPRPIMLEALVMECIRRNSQGLACLGMQHVADRFFKAREQERLKPVALANQQRLSQDTWEVQLRLTLQVLLPRRAICSCSLVQLASEMPLTIAGATLVLRECLRSVVQSAATMLVVPRSALNSSMRLADTDRRVLWMHSQWALPLQLLVLVQRRVIDMPASGSSSPPVQIGEVLLDAILRAWTLMLPSAPSAITLEHGSSGTQAWLAELELTLTSEQRTSLAAAAAFPSEASDKAVHHLLSCLSLFVRYLLGEDVISSLRIGLVVGRITSHVSQVSAGHRWSLLSLASLLLGHSPFLPWCPPEHALRLVSLVAMENPSTLLPLLRMQLQDCTDVATLQPLFCSPALLALFLQHPLSFIRDVLPLLSANTLRQSVVSALVHAGGGCDLLAASDSGLVSKSASALARLAPWNAGLVALVVEINRMRADATSSAVFIEQLLASCFRSTPRSVLAPHSLGSRLECLRLLAPSLSSADLSVAWSMVGKHFETDALTFVKRHAKFKESLSHVDGHRSASLPNGKRRVA